MRAEKTREARREIWMRTLGHIDITKRERAEKRMENAPAIREADVRERGEGET